MNKRLLSTLVIVVTFFFSTKLSAQNIINSGVVTTQNFNSMGSSSTASLPVGWKVSGAGAGSAATYATSTITAVTQAANSGTPVTGGVYNWGNTAGTDRALGFLGNGYGSPNAIIAQYTNNTGSTITTTTISFAAERYVTDNSAFTLSFFYSTDDNTYTSAPVGNIASTVFPTGALSASFPGTTTSTTVTITGLNIAAGSNIYFKWVFTTGTSNSQGIGLDDVAVSSGFTTLSATLTSTLTTDAAPTGKPNPGDVIAYTTTVTNNGSDVARNVQVTQPVSSNTTLNGSVKTSALANDDNYQTAVNTALNGTTVLANDYGLPTISLVSYGSSAGTEGNFPPGIPSPTAAGGVVLMNPDGRFSYTPPNNFVGFDQFYYVAGTGTLPNNDAIVTIAVGTPATANGDSYPSAIGNMTVTDNVITNDQGSGTLNVTAVNGSAGNVGNSTATPHGSVTVNSNGTFTYNPNAGYTGTDQFTYTISNAFNLPSTATVNITLSNRIWFVNNAVASNGDGTQAAPFKQTSNVTGTSAGDNIFFYESASAYTGSITLLNNQKLIGQDASNDLATITGLTFPSYNTAPSMNPGSGTVSLTASNANIVTLAIGNTIRGLTLSNAGTGKKLTGTSFGTLTIGNNTTPDVTLNGTGEAMDLSTGVFGSASGLTSVQSSSSATQGISLSGITGSINFGSTNISGNTTQGILIGTTTADISFGNTIVSGGTDGVSFQNNSNGGHALTFGTLSVTGGSGDAFLHGAGGGNVTVGGTAVLSSADDPVEIANAGSGTSINFQSSVSATRTGSGGEGIHWSGANTGATITFNSLTVQTNAGTGMNLSGGGSVNVTNGTGTINTVTQAAPAIIATGILLDANFASINSSGGTNGVSLTNITGTSNFGTGSLSGATGATFTVSGGSANITYSGSMTQANNAALVGVINGNSGTLIFNTGTLSATNGTGLQFDNADGTYSFNGTNTLNGGDAGIDILNGSNGSFTFSSNSSITNPTGTAFNMSNSNASGSYSGSISDNSGYAVDIDNHEANTFTFQTGNITSTGTGIRVQNSNSGTIAFSNPSISLTTGSFSGVDLTTSNAGGIVRFTGGGLVITTTSGTGFNATGGGTVYVSGSNNTISSGTGTALNITNTTIGGSGVTFKSISANGGANGIFLSNTGTSGGLTVTGDGSNTTKGGNASGGTIQNMNGADASTNGIGIYLNNTSNVVLRRMTITGTIQNIGISGLSVTGFTLQYSTISGTSGTTSGSNDLNLEGPIIFGRTAPSTADGLFGIGLIDNCIISGGIQHNSQFYNQSGTHNLTISNSDIKSNGAALGADGINIEMIGTANSTISVQSCTLDDNASQAMQLSALASSVVDLTVNNCTIKKTTQGNEGVVLQNGGSAHLTLHFTSNTVTGFLGNLFTVGTVAGQGTSSASLIAVVKNNTFTQGSPASNRAVIFFPSGVQAPGNVPTSNVLFDNNTITADGDSQPLFLSTPDANTSPSYTATVTNNHVTLNSATATIGIDISATQGTTSNGVSACDRVSGNVVTYTSGTPAGVHGIRVRQANPGGGAVNPTVNLEQGTSSSNVAATVLADNNPGSTTTISGTVNVVPNGTCSAAPTRIGAPFLDVKKSKK